MNRVISYTDTKGNTIGYEYDSNGNLLKLVYPDGKAVSYGYNANNQLITVTDWGNRITTYEYDNNGRLIKESRPNGTYQTYTYNNAGQLTYTVDKTDDNRIINEYSYEYDPDGNIITEDSINEPNYDNITIPSSEMNYGSANRLIDFNGIAISYDNDGNMLNTPLGNKWGILTYDSRNMLTDVVTSNGAIEYEYDAENNRTLKTEYGKTTSYVVNPNISLSQVLTSTKDGETTYYIYGLGLIAEEKDDTYKTYHYDYRGSTTAITDEQGNTTDRIYYDVHGSVINRTGTTNTPFLYVGQYGVETDDNGLYYMRARYYNPTIQRFVNVDPIRDGLNWYGYVEGNPVLYIDSLGLAWNGGKWISSGNIFVDIFDFITNTQIVNPDEKNFNVNKNVNFETITEDTTLVAETITDNDTQKKIIAYANPNNALGLTNDEKIANAEYIYHYLSNKGWSKEAICGLLGNIQQESQMNPVAWQNNYKDNEKENGYGLVQWTPATKFEMIIKQNIEDIEDVNKSNPEILIKIQLDSIISSSQPGQGEWLKGSAVDLYGSPYKMDFDEFICSKNNPEELALVFHGHYERSSDTEEIKKNRSTYAKFWYEYFS